METKRLIAAIPLIDNRLLVCFDTEEIRLYSFAVLLKQMPGLSLLENSKLFEQIQLESDGKELVWPGCCRISAQQLSQLGEMLPLTREDFVRFCQVQLLSTTETAQMLRCTRQNIDSLVRRQRLRPVKCYAKNKLFLRSDVLRRMWELS